MHEGNLNTCAVKSQPKMGAVAFDASTRGAYQNDAGCIERSTPTPSIGSRHPRDNSAESGWRATEPLFIGRRRCSLYFDRV